MTVQSNLGDHGNMTQIEIESPILRSKTGGQLELLVVRAGAGKILDSEIGMIGPRDEPLQCYMVRSFPSLREIRVPTRP